MSGRHAGQPEPCCRRSESASIALHARYPRPRGPDINHPRIPRAVSPPPPASPAPTPRPPRPPRPRPRRPPRAAGPGPGAELPAAGARASVPERTASHEPPPSARAVPRPAGAAGPQRSGGGGEAAARGSSGDGVDAVTGGRRAMGCHRSGGLPRPVSTRVFLTRTPRARATSTIRAI
jgi:hypothetical protein